MNNVKKLTMITITFRGRQHTYFVWARMENQRARVSQDVLDRVLDRLGVRRGDTYSIG